MFVRGWVQLVTQADSGGLQSSQCVVLLWTFFFFLLLFLFFTPSVRRGDMDKTYPGCK